MPHDYPSLREALRAPKNGSTFSALLPTAAASEFSSANAPREVIDIYHKAKADKLDDGAQDDQAHRHAMRMVHHGGWYKGKKGWKRVHPDISKKINIRDAVKQPDGTYIIEDVPVFYPNATKGEIFTPERIKTVIENTNRMIAQGGQRPGLIEGHPPDLSPETPALLQAQIGAQFRPVGYGVNWREMPDRSGWAMCDLVDVLPSYVESQAKYPLPGLSAGISWDEGKLNARFNHIAALGSSLQALSQLPRTELSEIYSSNHVCFSAEAPAGSFTKGTKMPMTPEQKEMLGKKAACYAALSASFQSYAAEEPDAANKLEEAKNAYREVFDSEMPDEPLMMQAAALETEPSDGPQVIEEEAPSHPNQQEHEGEHKFSSDPAMNEVIAENKRLQTTVRGLAGKIAKKDFDSEVAELKRNGHALPPQKNLEKMFNLCFSSSDPATALVDLTDALKATPKSTPAANVGRVAANYGHTEAPSFANTTIASKTAPNRTDTHKSLGVQFNSEDIDRGLKFESAFSEALAK